VNHFPELLEEIKSTKGLERKRFFLEYCKKLIVLVDSGALREEDAAYDIVRAIFIDGIMEDSELERIIDAATTTEIPRETSYAQAIGQWDQRTADSIKREEWNAVVLAVKNLEMSLSTT